jgi:hypothetical protein
LLAVIVFDHHRLLIHACRWDVMLEYAITEVPTTKEVHIETILPFHSSHFQGLNLHAV